jgi:beta-N-acetylhexosaminidase
LLAALLAVWSLPRAGLAQTATPAPPATQVSPEEADLAAQVEAHLARMTVADRVGQLFLIGFVGSSTGFESDIAELIYGYRVGGVVLTPRNNNFTNEPDLETPVQVATLINRLQALAYGLILPADQALRSPPGSVWPPTGAVSMEEVTTVPPLNLPLLIALEQSGDGLPDTALRRGFTPQPSPMALGATWNPALVSQVGQIVGRELAAVGVNLLLGPNLDVVAQPRADAVGALGLYSFGGDPEWVGQMGRAYITGVHTGGGGRVAVVARHFPGAGDADRLPDEEVATVQRSLEELERLTLPPFRAVTRAPSSLLQPGGDPAAVEGMMSGHIRYSGFQGASLGGNTPISLAPELQALLDQEGFTTWRDQGGLLVSNMLGTPAIRRHYDPTGADFPYRRAAMDAFTAGHDLLYLDRFSLDDLWETEKSNIKETIAFFQERYMRDPDFAARVDASVRRILALKLRLYPPASASNDGAPPILLANVLVHENDLQALDQTQQDAALVTVGQVARESFTVLYPEPAANAEAVSVVPQADDRIVIVTESRVLRECEACGPETAVGTEDLATIVNRLYGPSGTGQLTAEQVVSLSAGDVAQLLASEATGPPNEPTPTLALLPTPTPAFLPTPVQGQESNVAAAAPPDRLTRTRLLLDQADWIIFAMLDVDAATYPNSDVVKQFLRRRGAQLSDKRIIVLALHAPYFLDATEISKLNGYYGVYGKTMPFLESTVRALFRAYTPSGAPPVNVPGTRYGNLAERLRPDPTRPIDLLVTGADGAVIAGGAEAPAAALLEAGAGVRIQAGPIYDRNGKPVRNGTLVDLTVAYDADPTANVVERVPTQNGVALRELTLNRGGEVRVTAAADGAVSTEEIVFSVQAPPAAALPVTLTTPAVITVETTPVAPVVAAPPTDGSDDPINLISFLIALITIAMTLSLLLVALVRVAPRRTLVHSLLWAVNFGLAAYIAYSLGLLPGGMWLQSSLKVWGAGPVVLLAMLLPLVWLQLRAID